MRARLLALAAALASSAVLAVGCGGGGGSSPADLAAFAPPGSPLYLQVEMQPHEPNKASVDAIAKRVGGIDNLGSFIVSKLEESAREEGEPFDFSKEVEPWLGERAAVFFTKQGLENDNGNFVIESTDPQRTQAFIDAQTKAGAHPYRDVTYKGVQFKVGGKKDNAIGVVDGALVQAEDEREFQGIVNATSSESLADQERFKDAFSHTTAGSFADAYVDIGGLVKGDKSLTPQAMAVFKALGVELPESTLVASLLPSPEHVELDLNTDLVGGGTSGGGSKLLGSLPGGAFAAIALSDLGKRLHEAVDRLDAGGIPPEVPPHQLKQALEAKGIDLDRIASGLGDAAVFAIGAQRRTLGGALVVTAENPSRAANTVSNLGLLLRIAGTPGVTALRGKATGFSIHSSGLGEKPLVIAAKGSRIAIGYGLPATYIGLSEGSGTLSESPDYKAAVSALGDTPITGFADGSASLRLAEALVPPSESGFNEAKRYLRSIRYVAVGSSSEDGRAAAKLIVGVAK